MTTVKKLLCQPCGERVMGYPDDLDPEINSLFIEGTVIQRVPGVMKIRDMNTGKVISETVFTKVICDSCGRLVQVGDKGIAWSEWRMGTKRDEGWEKELLSDLRVVKEQMRE